MDQDIKVSLFASAVRPKLWKYFFMYIPHPEIEIVFAGPKRPLEMGSVLPRNTLNDGSQTHAPILENFLYIFTENIKPAQCYEIARRSCIGEVVVWVADDCEFPNNVILEAYNYWKSRNNDKLILSIQTKESGYNLPKGQLFDMKQHCFFGYCPDTPLMAPLAMMSRKFLDELGGIDQRYVCGQYENDIIMRAYQHGATVEIFGGLDYYIDIDHLGKSLAIGESKVEEDFLHRPFAKGYQQDRRILEESWCRFNQNKLEEHIRSGRQQVHQSEVYDISPFQLDKFQPYPDLIPLDHSLSNKGIWE